jgi:hypothetical protein
MRRLKRNTLGGTTTMNDIWGPVSLDEWRSVPCVSGRPATEDDVRAGRAVFYVQGESAAAPIPLPSCTTQTLENGTKQRVVVIQAEIGPQGTILGVRPLSGGNGACMDFEVEFLPEGVETENVE